MSTVFVPEIEENSGAAESRTESDLANGRRYADPYRFDCPETAVMRRLVETWKDLQKIRIAMGQREADDELCAGLKLMEDRARRAVGRALVAHPIWPWLHNKSGLAGPSTAFVMSKIGNPLRFPGQQCSERHFLPAGLFGVGECCPLLLADSRNEIEVTSGEHLSGAIGFDGANDPVVGCPGIILPARPHTGVKAVYKMCGLDVDKDGRSPRKTRGRQCNWNPQVRATLLMKDVGIAAQIVKHRPEPYRAIYDEQKARLIAERPDAQPIALDRLAQKIAVKAFVGDLFMEWKRLAADKLDV